MSAIIVTSESTLQEICDLFQERYLYLQLCFYSQEEGRRKCTSGITPITDLTLHIGDIGNASHGTAGTLQIRDSMAVTDIGVVFLQTFGVYAGTAYRDKYGAAFAVSDEAEGKTISEFNALCKKQGCKERPGFMVEVDDSSVKSDRITYVFRCIHRDIAEKLRKVEPVTDEHYARGKRAWLYREYAAEVKDFAIEKFVLEWDPDTSEFIFGFVIAAPEKMAKTIGRHPTEQEVIAYYKEFDDRCAQADYNFDVEKRICFFVITNVEYDTFLEFNDQFIEPICDMYRTLQKNHKDVTNAIFGSELEAFKERVSAGMDEIMKKLKDQVGEFPATVEKTAPPPTIHTPEPQHKKLKLKTIIIAGGVVLLVAWLLIYLFGSSGQ